MARGEVNRQGVVGCCLVIVAIFMVLWGAEIGGLKSSYGGKGGKPQKGGVDTSAILSELLTYFSPYALLYM